MFLKRLKFLNKIDLKKYKNFLMLQVEKIHSISICIGSLIVWCLQLFIEQRKKIINKLIKNLNNKSHHSGSIQNQKKEEIEEWVNEFKILALTLTLLLMEVRAVLLKEKEQIELQALHQLLSFIIDSKKTIIRQL